MHYFFKHAPWPVVLCSLIAPSLSAATVTEELSNLTQNPYRHLLTRAEKLDYSSSNNGKRRPLIKDHDTATTQVSSNDLASLFHHLFSDGSYTVYLGSSYINTGTIYWGYGANIFAQTGRIHGFALGGQAQFSNPFWANQINNPNEPSYFSLPSTKANAVSQAYVQYLQPDTFEVAAGRIILDSPWVGSYLSSALNQYTYQGAQAKYIINPTVTLTGFAFNRSKSFSSHHFNQATLYNQSIDPGTMVTTDQKSHDTIALGLKTNNKKAPWSGNLWAYSFANYADMLYGEVNFQHPINANRDFFIHTQGLVETNPHRGTSTFKSETTGDVNSQMIGLETGFDQQNIHFSLAFSHIFKHENAYEQGGIVSPYTYVVASDPLYTTSWIAGMVEKSSGSAYKISSTFNWWDNQFSMTPSLAFYDTNTINNNGEYDLTFKLDPDVIQGFSLQVALAYLQDYKNSDNNSKEVQLMASYAF